MRMLLASALMMVATAAAAQVVVDPPKPANDLARRSAYHHFVRGQEYLQSELYDKAANEFQQAIKHDRLFTDAHFGLGQSYMGLRRYASAIQAFDRTLDAARTIFGMREHDRAKTDLLITDQLRALREALAQTARMPVGQRAAVLNIESRIRGLHGIRPAAGGGRGRKERGEEWLPREPATERRHQAIVIVRHTIRPINTPIDSFH